jgi:hypothetical protein
MGKTVFKVTEEMKQ